MARLQGQHRSRTYQMTRILATHLYPKTSCVQEVKMRPGCRSPLHNTYHQKGVHALCVDAGRQKLPLDSRPCYFLDLPPTQSRPPVPHNCKGLVIARHRPVYCPPEQSASFLQNVATDSRRPQFIFGLNTTEERDGCQAVGHRHLHLQAPPLP